MPKRRAVTEEGKRVARALTGIIKENGLNITDVAARLSEAAGAPVDYHALSRRLNGTNPIDIGEIIDIVKQLDPENWQELFAEVFRRAAVLKP